MPPYIHATHIAKTSVFGASLEPWKKHSNHKGSLIKWLMWEDKQKINANPCGHGFCVETHHWVLSMGWFVLKKSQLVFQNGIKLIWWGVSPAPMLGHNSSLLGWLRLCRCRWAQWAESHRVLPALSRFSLSFAAYFSTNHGINSCRNSDLFIRTHERVFQIDQKPMY